MGKVNEILRICKLMHKQGLLLSQSIVTSSTKQNETKETNSDIFVLHSKINVMGQLHTKLSFLSKIIPLRLSCIRVI